MCSSDLVDDEQALPERLLALVELLGAHVGPPHAERLPLPEEDEGGDAQQAPMPLVLLLPALQGHKLHLAVAHGGHALLADDVVVLLVDVLIRHDPKRMPNALLATRLCVSASFERPV